VEREKRTYQHYIPLTALGRKLLSLRRRAIERGMKLHDQDVILVSVRENRGERTCEEEEENAPAGGRGVCLE